MHCSWPAIFHPLGGGSATQFQPCPRKGPDPNKCVSVGFLVRENNQGKIIVPTIADVEHRDTRHVYGAIMFPSCAILSVKQITRV
jgi:hypothetical protein